MGELPVKTIGFIGLGRMGRGMAGNLAKAARADLIVYDPVAEATQALAGLGARPVASIAEVAREAEIVFTSLPGPAEVETVALGEGGLLSEMRPGLTWFDLSTSSRVLALRLEAAFREKGGTMLDAPVSGGPAGAASGDLVLWAGGDRQVFDRHLEVLRTFVSTPLHVGPIGAGTVTKLAHNILGYTIMEAMAESFSLAVKAGLDPVEFWEALRFGMVGKQSPLFMLTQQFLPAVYDRPAFALRLALKDVRLATAMAEELGVPMRLSGATRADMEKAVADGLGDEDSRAFLKLQLERAGVAIAAEPARIAAAVAAARG
jgi:3-hydroxyisobutyrate dehydrogenase